MDMSFEQPTTGFPGDAVAPNNDQVATDVLIAYLRNLLQVLLGASQDDLNSSIFADTSETTSKLTAFAVDPNPVVMFVLKEQIRSNEAMAELNGTTYSYSIRPELSPSHNLISVLAIIKRQSPIDMASPLDMQLQVVNLPSSKISGLEESQTPGTASTSPSEILYSLVHLAIGPYFDAFTRAKENFATTGPGGNGVAPDADSKTGIPAAKKRFAELELSLLHLQQDNEIPQVALTFHPIIQQALDKANRLNTTPTIDMIQTDLLSDAKFLNALQSNVNSWIKSIQSITKMARDAANGTATQEINFWLSLEVALEDVERQLQHDGVTLTIAVLRHAKRFHATISFTSDTGLKESMELVKKYNLLMHEFPIDDLLSAPTLLRLKEATVNVFNHLNRKIKVSPYPIRRALPLVEAISGDLDNQFHALLSGRRLMHLEYAEFQKVASVAEDVFSTWDYQIKEFTNVAREVTRKRAEKFIPIRIRARHSATQERLSYLKSFRQAHEQLQATISTVLGLQGASGVDSGHYANTVKELGAFDVVTELAEAYIALRDVDVLDVSPEGTEIWIAAENAYNERTSRIEDAIILQLRDRLATAKTANEMFRVFSRFNALFIRPKIRGAIQEYQTQLIDSVKADIQSLHSRFIGQYANSEAYQMATVRDIPPVSGAIIWVRQIERQLNLYMKRVEDVLGKGWELYAEGEKLQNESNAFRKKLDTKTIFESWLRAVTERKVSVSGRLFDIVRNRSAGNRLELAVNFDPQVIALFKEVRNLTYLKFQVPHAINSVSKEAKRVYPYAMSLMNILRIYTQISSAIEDLGDANILMHEYQNSVQGLIQVGMKLKWESFVQASYDVKPLSYTAGETSVSHESRQVQWIRDVVSAVSVLERKAGLLVVVSEDIQSCLDSLGTCEYDHNVLSNALQSVQDSIDKMNLENFSNLRYFVARLNDKIRDILLSRLRFATANWVDNFKNANTSSDASGSLKAQPIRLEVTIKNQTISLLPPLEHARATWYTEFHDCIGVVCRLQRLNSSRYEVKVEADSNATSMAMFSELPSLAVDELQNAYAVIESKLDDVRSYTSKWFQFQSLWDLQPEKVYALLGDDLSKWVQVLQDIRKVRATFDTAEASRDFGNIVVDYEQVQARINAKYDTWQQNILIRFADILSGNIRDTYLDLERTRRELEVQTLDMSSTKRAVAFVTIVQTAKGKAVPWEEHIDSFRTGQITLSRNRYQFPADWIFIDQIDGEWAAFKEILQRKVKIVEEKLDVLRTQVFAEHQLMLDHVNRAVNDWNSEKPVTGTIAPDTAFVTLEKFDRRLSQLKTEQDLTLSAKEALEVELPVSSALEIAVQEVQDFKSVWSALSSIWQSLNDLRDTPWASVVPRKVKRNIDDLIKMTKEMPSRMRQYSSFEYVQGILRQFLKSGPLLADLKSEVMKDRHWEKVYKTIKPKEHIHLASMTLGNVWDLNILSNEGTINDILAQARGELALEDFLKQVRETWAIYTLDLVNYQNKCRLIRGWDALFEKCTEHMSSLTTIRNSPYFKQFEEEASSWEDKLNRINSLFDSWLDVQRQWVYLEGVFSSNVEIKNLLPVESSRFQNVNSEFSTLMRKVAKTPNVLDVLNIPGARSSLDRLADLLAKVQKALGEYLEREREQFPRYYFVGDEDLLEIIGNAKDTIRIQKHLKKMFAGVAGLVVDEENSAITGFTSKEGEVVELKEPISLIKTTKVNEWLGQLEISMRETLASYLSESVRDYRVVFGHKSLTPENLISWIRKYPAQVTIVASQVVWTETTEKTLATEPSNLSEVVDQEILLLELLASIVLQQLNRIDRKKCEGLITELVHQRNMIQKLLLQKAVSTDDYGWRSTMTFHYSEQKSLVDRLEVRMGSACFQYGFEYLGIPDRLVQTPLTDKCFLTLTGALEQSFGGSPFGPAGTGKTETVKALGVQLGRFVVVFNCDEAFDFQSIGRIFLGIGQVGAWGCFDEFNRLDEKILSAVSSQIQSIQLGLRALKLNVSAKVELIGKEFAINKDTGIFITMNPGYAGRAKLPDNLKKLFRSISMSRPDKELIAEVILYAQGFVAARDLSMKIVPLFEDMVARLSRQPHYDFGLRALKSALVTSGELKRRQTLNLDYDSSRLRNEDEMVLQSIHESIAPKLVGEDSQIFVQLEEDAFPGIKYIPEDLTGLLSSIVKIATDNGLMVADKWLTKCLQLYQIQNIHHGVMMVGESGCGKTSTWQILLRALQELEGTEGVFYIIDSKVMSKEDLYGNFDRTTREWTDGLFTGILRKINDGHRGESLKRHWIVFDGDVDPEWAENLNSVLDDNKILTLPNGERLSLLSNVRIFFEVDSMKYATLATISRCGMVWFGTDTVSTHMLVKSYINKLRTTAFEDSDDALPLIPAVSNTSSDRTTVAIADQLEKIFLREEWLDTILHEAAGCSHIMEFSASRALHTLFSLTTSSVTKILEYDSLHPDFAVSKDQRETYLISKLLVNLIWSCVGDCPLSDRQIFARYLCRLELFAGLDIPADDSVLDYDMSLPLANWVSWQSQVPKMDLDPHTITKTDIVIPTVDTVRHEALLNSCLQEKRALVLCGPPGSGKTMSLFNTLRKFPSMDVVGLNFSSATNPELVMKTIEQYCEYRKTHNGMVLSPNQVGRRLVIFCDEINLPAPDKYGTQSVIFFLRQLIEHNGFWRVSDKSWVSLERIQFVGACNPPTDAGRTVLGLRFLRHASLIMIDYPGQLSLNQIYGTFNAAVLKSVPSLRGYGKALTSAMVDFYSSSQSRFTAKQQSHYVYSPRELTRWVRGIHETIHPLESTSLEGLVRIWAHEALRLFGDRLVTEDEKQWTEDEIAKVVQRHFLGIKELEALEGPILYSNWLSKNYVPVELAELREFTNARLKTFCEEELDVPLVLFDEALDHILRIDRVFRQPQGHLILIGISGSGKTTLARFVAWMNGLRVFQINAHKNYTAEDFDEDLRDVLRSCGCKGQKVCFILDESNVMDSAFLERMNTLLANAEIPGLFEGDSYNGLLSSCRDGARQQGLILDSQEELYNWFREQVIRNLHVVFTMNPPKEGLSSRAATSPALFNRCVLNWMGDWSDSALYQVGFELTQSLDLDDTSYAPPQTLELAYRKLPWPPSHREAVVNGLVHVHMSMKALNKRLAVQQRKINYATPRHFLDFLSQFGKVFNEKRSELEEQQRHLNVGLEKLHDTVEKVRHLRTGLAEKQKQLEIKNFQANQKLQQMVVDQKEAEQKRTESLKIQEELAIEEQEIVSRQEIVMNDLAKAEPAVIEAQQSVSNIKKQHLTEVRSMGNPPEAVRMAMEAVCTLLGHKVDSWRSVQSVIRRDDFISSIVNFNTDRQMTRPLRNKMQAEYLSRSNFNFDTVNRASKACGPLILWLEAQVNYSLILESIGPLREEVAMLTANAEETKVRVKEMAAVIEELEGSIERYKEEYAVLISEVQEIKGEMSKVESKVDRSVTLLSNLAAERERWRIESQSFEKLSTTLAGDSLLSAALLVYGGFFDQQYRKQMVQGWQDYLAQSNIAFILQNSISEYLSSMSDRDKWHNNSLPAGELYEENAIMLERFNRYPLIIDPTGRTVEFLRKQHSDRGLIVTSFLDDAFVKQLESALRFGNALLINDAEHFNPILNHVLNKEYQRVGGRVLIQLGRQEIDFSPDFKLYLCTRDPSAVFAPDICSRTTFVNFTVTRSNLLAEALNELLKVLRPDVERKRGNLIKLRRDFIVRLRQLERSLLQALNDSQGNILDDDNVIATLEQLKAQAEDISRKMDETEGVMAKIDEIASQYYPIAEASSTIYAILELLPNLNPYYQFSLEFFQSIFLSVLNSTPDAKESGMTQKLNTIMFRLNVEAFMRTSQALHHSDVLILASFFAYGKLNNGDISIIEELFNKEQQFVDLSADSYELPQLIAHAKSSALFAGKGVIDEESLKAFLTEPDFASTDIDSKLYRILFMKLVRSDRYVQTVNSLIAEAFGAQFFADIREDISHVVLREVNATTPIAICSVPGYDASYRIENIVKAHGIKCVSVAMGSEESIAAADRAIAEGAQRGFWVLLKNVHLAPGWLDLLEKRIRMLRVEPQFRIFLALETTDYVPTNLLRTSRILMFEPPPGVRANMKDMLGSIDKSEIARDPVERARLYFIFAWFHAVVQERLRYGSVGWKKVYDFNDSDFAFGKYIIDTWLAIAAGGRSNVAPECIPWVAIKSLLADSVYGAKVDDESDLASLRELVEHVLTPKVFEHYDIARGPPELLVPDGSKVDGFFEWVEALPEEEPATWLGLPEGAVKV
ncbi:dynein heavy chain, N-terminal region 1-domain-containing protein [Lipomyces kononenkoae]|uniref:Dynein heavy chain, N-terminal region 1-domain-containing protein n=1 Tax=Lipomyces kononenkoae TaxID=34357 RepID=A0ACC3T994_LIPKO